MDKIELTQAIEQHKKEANALKEQIIFHTKFLENARRISQNPNYRSLFNF